MHVKAVHKHIGEIYPRSLFHQHLTSSFFVEKCYAKLFSTYTLALQFFYQKEISIKAACEMLVKLATIVNFTNILQVVLSKKVF